MKVTILGSGTPLPAVERAGPAFLLHLPDRIVQVDAGGDCVRRQLDSGISPQDITQLFITHLHTDHILGFGHLVFSGWTLEGRTGLDVFGPAGTKRMHDLLFQDLYREDIKYRMSLGRSGKGLTDMHVRESTPGEIYSDSLLRVRAAKGIHSFYDLAYRFDHDGRAVVFTGDTAPSEDVAVLAKGAKVLFHDCTLAPGVEDMFRRRSKHSPDLWRKLSTEHSTPEAAGRVAAQAGVEKLILIHVHPGADVGAIVAAASSTFSGEVVVGRDLMEVDV